MNSMYSKSLIVLVSLAFSFFASCHSSTDESTAQLTHTATPQNSSRGATTRSIRQNELAQPIKLLPVDEGLQDLSLKEFREQLLVSVRNRDEGRILKVLDPEIENGYDIERGIVEFKKIWKPEDPSSALWSILSSILTGGGSFKERDNHPEFCGPYVVSQWPRVVKQLPKETDTLEYLAIKGENVAVRREARLDAPVVTRLSYDVVKSIPNSQVVDRTTEFSSWIKVRVPTGDEGYVSDNYLGSPMDHGACFKKLNGRWLITELAARQ